MSYSIGHTLVTPLSDGRVSYAPCRQCGEECRGHSIVGRLEAQEVPSGAWCRTCGESCPRAQCDACRADGEMNEMQAPRVTIDRQTAEILSDAAHAQACELRRLAEDCTPDGLAAILAEAAEIEDARAAIDAALGRSP